MKKILTIAILLTSFCVSSQKIYNLDKKRNTSEITNDSAIYHGKKHPVYLSVNGKLFIYVVSKKGNTYKKYIK
jgi:hypothetical protein